MNDFVIKDRVIKVHLPQWDLKHGRNKVVQVAGTQKRLEECKIYRQTLWLSMLSV